MPTPLRPLLFSATLLAIIAMVGTVAHAQSAVVYKHVDAQGRVTYSNAPIKGGAVVDLPALTIIPGSPTGSLNESKPSVAAPKENVAPAAGTGAVARVTATPPLPGNGNAAAAQTAAQAAQQRREDVRRRILEGEIEAEMQLLAEARTQLEDEQSRSNAIRALRTAIAQPGAESRSDHAESRAAIERHFERVRDLQDQIAMHQQNLADLRSQLKPATFARISASVAP